MDTPHDLTAWVNEYTAPMVSWAIKRTADPDLAQDLVQETFMAAVERISKFEGKSSPKTWLFSILSNKIVDYYRRKGREAKTDFDSVSDYFDEDGGWLKHSQSGPWTNSDEHLLDNEEFVLVLEDCIDSLPDLWKTSIRLKYLSEKKGEEICQDLGITPSNYWQIVRRAKLSLRDCIDTNWR